HRNENGQFTPDSIEQNGQLAGFGGAAVAINNSLAVDEEFIELRAPLLQDKPFSKDLLFGTGFRHSNYSVSGGVNTYKFDLQWAPIQDLRFRGSYQRAIRAPSIIELYNPQLLGLIQFGNDPCAPPVQAGVTLAQCLATGNPSYCALIVRDQFFGLSGATIAGGGYFVQTSQNIGSGLTSGIDLQSSYKVGLGHVGSLVWAINGVYLLHATTQPIAGGPHYDCAGLFGLTCQTVNPRWRHNMRATWEMPWNVDASLNWRFIGKVGNDNNDPQPQLHLVAYQGSFDQDLQQIPNISYVDLSFGYRGWKGVDVRGGVNNLFDRNPPLVPVAIQPGGAPNTYGTYEALGRQLYLAL